jgi:TolB-like protein
MTEAPRQSKKRLKAPAAPSAPTAVDNTPPLAGRTGAIWARIKQHKVVQWTLAYLAIAYTLLHGAEMLVDSLGWSHSLQRLFTLILILGIPLVVTLAWYHGARGQQRASGTEVMIIALLLAVGGAILWRDRPTAHDDEQATAVTTVPSGSNAERPVASLKSIAVLPFVNMSSEKEQEYFADGLSEELLNLLSKVPDLRVAARTSSFYFKGKDVKLSDVARELQVAHVLEGSVRKSGNQIRVTAQLIRASDGYHQWSETYDRTLEDIFAVQEEIAANVVSQLKITLLGAPRKTHTTKPDAYALYLEALQLGNRGGTPRFDEIIALYEKALEIDPNYAPAWLGLSAMYAGKADLGMLPLAEGMERSREMAHKALAIDPQYGLAHAGLGWLALKYDHDLAAAAPHFEQALALSPNDMDILSLAFELSRALGRVDLEVPLGEYFVTRDPLNPGTHIFLGNAYFNAGRWEDAITSLRTALKLDPTRVFQHERIGDALLLSSDYEGALSEYEKLPQGPGRLGGLACAYHDLGQAKESDAALSELIEKHKNWATAIALAFTYRGENDRAFEWLEKAVVNRDSELSSLPSNLWFKNLHDDPRWLPFLRKIGKAPEQLAAIKFELEVPTH